MTLIMAGDMPKCSKFANSIMFVDDITMIMSDRDLKFLRRKVNNDHRRISQGSGAVSPLELGKTSNAGRKTSYLCVNVNIMLSSTLVTISINWCSQYTICTSSFEVI